LSNILHKVSGYDIIGENDTVSLPPLGTMASKFSFAWLAFMLRIWEVPISNFGPAADYPNRGFRDFPHFLKDVTGILYLNRPLQLPSASA